MIIFIAVWPLVGFLLMFCWMVGVRRQTALRERSRLSGKRLSFVGSVNHQIDLVASSLVTKEGDSQLKTSEDLRGGDVKVRQLYEAGLESTTSQGKYLMFKIGSLVASVALGAVTYLYWSTYYATVFTLFSTMAGIVVPMIWLKVRTGRRTESILRELPLLLDLTNLGTSAGWDVSSSLERVIDALYVQMPDHVLIKEMKRARWLIASGYTWDEALKSVSHRISDDNVRRTCLALGQAIKQGGDRTSQLEGIATDAMRIYHSELDKRLAALPVYTVLLSMGLMISYFLIIMGPSVLALKNSAAMFIGGF